MLKYFVPFSTGKDGAPIHHGKRSVVIQAGSWCEAREIAESLTGRGRGQVDAVEVGRRHAKELNPLVVLVHRTRAGELRTIARRRAKVLELAQCAEPTPARLS
jgi:hypothetical protein